MMKPYVVILRNEAEPVRMGDEESHGAYAREFNFAEHTLDGILRRSSSE